MHLCKAKIMDEANAYAFVCELEECTFDGALFHKHWIQTLQDDSISYYFLVHENKQIGFCSLRMVRHLHHCAMVAQVEEFVIKQAYRHCGYGRFMFEQLVSLAIEGNCIMVELSSHQKRSQAHLFYEQMGMTCQHYKFTKQL